LTDGVIEIKELIKPLFIENRLPLQSAKGSYGG
jgi:hypothetical protein